VTRSFRLRAEGLEDRFVAQFRRRFGPLTPNAAVMFQDDRGDLRTVTLNLTSARMDGDNAVFDVTFAGRPTRGRLTLPLLFVDQAAAAPNTAEMPPPSPGVTDLTQVLFTSDAVVALNKTLTLTKNSARTVYPFLRDVNDGFYQGNEGAGWA
jgi:hypothetical protein